jgi:secretion/DNA translocation related TadE-like protein
VNARCRAGRARGRRADERGAAALLAVTLGVVLLLCTTAAVVAGRLLVDARRVASAADLAALAGAAAVQRGLDGCSQAQRVAAANGAVLTDCRIDGQVVRLAARTDSARFLGRLFRPSAEARAGPVR